MIKRYMHKKQTMKIFDKKIIIKIKKEGEREKKAASITA